MFSRMAGGQDVENTRIGVRQALPLWPSRPKLCAAPCMGCALCLDVTKPHCRGGCTAIRLVFSRTGPLLACADYGMGAGGGVKGLTLITVVVIIQA
jgi:hypothetical protein